MLEEAEYQNYKIVLSHHAWERAYEIGKSDIFILDKVRVARFSNRLKDGRIKLVNGDYTFICKLFPKADFNEFRDTVLVITIINANLRKAYNGKTN